MLKLLFSNDGLRSLFSLVLVSTILTVYELALFYTVVVPQITTQVDNGLDQLAIALYNKFTLSPDFVYVPQTIPEKMPQYQYLFTTNQVNEIRSVFNQSILAKENQQKTTNRILNVLKTFKEREQIYTKKINNYTVFVGILILSVLAIILFTIYRTLKNRNETIGKCTWSITFVTIGLILIFQYFFYIFGNKYQYIGSKGNEEMLVYILGTV